jgi:hypothetical protein
MTIQKGVGPCSAEFNQVNADLTTIEGKIDTVDTVVDRIEVDTTSIESKVDIIDTNVDDIDTKTDKIDGASTDGLSGSSNSLAYRVHEIEKHFHSPEFWFGAAAVPSGETHVADEVAGGISPFQATSGNDDWGSWVQIFGTADGGSMAAEGYVKVDMHEILISGASSNTGVYALQFGRGESGSQEIVTTVMFKPISNQVDSGPVAVMMARQDIPAKGWCRILCIGENAKTVDFYIGIHGYVG